MSDKLPHQTTLVSAREWLRAQCPGATDEQIRDGARRIANIVLFIHVSEPTLGLSERIAAARAARANNIDD
jgi:hypothetical protein